MASVPIGVSLDCTRARLAIAKAAIRAASESGRSVAVCMCRSVHTTQVIGPFENGIDVACKGGRSGRIESALRARSRHADRLVIPSDNAVYPGSIARYRDHDPSRDDRLKLGRDAQGGGNGSIRNAVVPAVIVRERIYWCVARGPGLAGAADDK